MSPHSRRDALAATADCSATPSAPTNVSTGQNVQLAGQHSFTITNSGDDPISVTLEAVLEDSTGNRFTDSQPLTVAGHSAESSTMRSFLTASYSSPGDVTVTARSNVSGDAFCSSSSGQRMHVS